MDGLVAYPQKKKFPGIRRSRGTTFFYSVSLLVRKVRHYPPTTSNKGSVLYDLIGISSQEMHKDRVEKTNLLDPVTQEDNCVQSEYIACTSNVLKGDSIGLVANGATIVTLTDHDDLSIKGY